jgi:hypothetical protein
MAGHRSVCQGNTLTGRHLLGESCAQISLRGHGAACTRSLHGCHDEVQLERLESPRRPLRRHIVSVAAIQSQPRSLRWSAAERDCGYGS